MTVDTSATPASFGEILARRAHEQPEARAFAFRGDDGEHGLTYADLDRRARSIGAAIRVAGATGERVLILYPPGLDYVAALFACFHAGAAAVPAYPPDPARLERTLPRLLAIVRDARPELVVTIGALRDMLEERLRGKHEARTLRYLATDAPLPDVDDSAAPPARPDEPALLQYTSGSTAAPRGVVLTHDNLLRNSDFIRRAFGHTPASRGVIWLPPYHDMGLIGGVLQPVYAGFPCVLMSPLTFLRRPLSWLRAVSDHRATTSGGPNFAYDLCVRRARPEQTADLDLTSWEVAFNGAEPVRAATIEAFCERFHDCGFRREAMFPCYGLAEGTLMVTGGPRLRPPRYQRLDERPGSPGTVVGCGASDSRDRVLIVDPESRTPLPPGRVGEIWVAGASVAAGYWDRPAETAATFGATLAGSAGGPFLRTGDLGVLRDGELFVTGRIKDLLIVGGRNHYPTDVELACEAAVPALRKGCGAAFTVERDGRERIVVVYEVAVGRSPDQNAVIRDVRRAVAQAIDAQVDAVALIEPRTIPKTSSGKVQRGLCRELFVGGRLDVVASWSLPSLKPSHHL